MGVQAGTIARVVGIEQTFKDLRGANTLLLPQSVAIIGQGASASTFPFEGTSITSAAEAATIFGAGSPVHLAALQCFPANGDGLGIIPCTIYPVADDGSGVAAAGTITPVGTQVGAAAYTVVVNGQVSDQFVIADQAVPDAPLALAIAAAINANPNMPVIATAAVNDCDLEAKWKGVSGNDITVLVVGPANGMTFTTDSPLTGGLVNPDVDDALNLIGPLVWETIIVNCLESNDDTTLDKIQVFGDLRATALVKQPLMAFVGTSADRTTRSAISDARKTDRINGFAAVTGCPNLPCVMAAAVATRVAQIANDDPPRDYGRAPLSSLEPGTDASQETHTEKQAAILAGASTSSIVDGVAVLSDTILFYHPVGEEPPAFRYAVDQVKLANVIFNLRAIFESIEWDGAPLIPDFQPTTNPSARRPKDAVAAVNVMIDGLALDAILSDPASAKKLTNAAIDTGNPKRLNVFITVQLAGNTNVISLDLFWGFFFGEKPLL